MFQSPLFQSVNNKLMLLDHENILLSCFISCPGSKLWKNFWKKSFYRVSRVFHVCHVYHVCFSLEKIGFYRTNFRWSTSWPKLLTFSGGGPHPLIRRVSLSVIILLKPSCISPITATFAHRYHIMQPDRYHFFEAVFTENDAHRQRAYFAINAHSRFTSFSLFTNQTAISPFLATLTASHLPNPARCRLRGLRHFCHSLSSFPARQTDLSEERVGRLPN